MKYPLLACAAPLTRRLRADGLAGKIVFAN